MWLRNKDHTVIVSPQGGSILQWQWRDHFILGPTRIVRTPGGELKTRGVTHWCFPNFGTIKPETGLAEFPQHGFLRETILTVTSHKSSSVVFEEQGELLDWPGARNIKVHVLLDDYGVQAQFFVTQGRLRGPRIPVLPALHPYFAVPPKGLSLIVGNKQIKGEDIQSNDHPTKDMVIERCGLPVCVHLHGIGRVSLEVPEDCSYVVVWSDNSSAYVCVEPIFGTPGTYGTPEGRWLEAGEALHCKVYFRFEAE